ncbi:hypothetical protein GGS23DRAFT_589054 [Durotheca rogersii]|uniref:uncharacterized protein n=1 Tax=Durotheca rogersii TaxID=419775 RepID=UPI00221F364E|nr:uncharacterized protein GGS23DRAFT_589054 [Durotheca rogersii]KAI5856218.1 hypothetical protein GGS23DRAFT_589054 [Durotheca rogersii]
MKFITMKFFRRSKKPSQSELSNTPARDDLERDKYWQYNTHHRDQYRYAERSSVFAPWFKLPPPILQRVLSFVCPHCCDESYETCEQSALENACMLCDLRDLSHAGQVSKRWREAAVKLMYHSIRIDSVHYCEREIDLSEKRKRRSRFNRNGVPEDTASARLSLLCRSLREDPTRLGVLVRYFKTPYMLRESSAPTLARTIAVLPNLRYVDLPEGLFSDDLAYQTLKFEVQARCPDLRKMTYACGSERSLEALSSGNVWQNLEVLELAKINMDPAVLRHVLSVLGCLRALKLSDCRVVDDNMFKYNDMLPAFPALEELLLVDMTRVTSDGLVAYLSREETRKKLNVLSLTNTGIQPFALHSILAYAPNLSTLSITNQVDTAFPSHVRPIPPLTNWSLRTLRFEITASAACSYASITDGYYNYLASSLFAGGLPRLSALYVRDQNFPDILLGLPLPTPGFAGSRHRPSSSSSAVLFSPGGAGLSPNSTNSFDNVPARFGSNNPFAPAAFDQSRGMGTLSLNQTLEVFTKGEDDIDWGSIRMDPFDTRGTAYNGAKGHRSSSSVTSGRPLSSYGLADSDPGWLGTGGARRSVVMQGTGSGGFLAVPGDTGVSSRRESAGTLGHHKEDLWPRPNSSHGPKKGDRDLWR